MDLLVPDRSNAAGLLPCMPVVNAVRTVRRAARVGARLYTAELEQIVARHHQRLHMYDDDCQVYLSTSVEDVPLTVSKFAACIANINSWLSACRLRLNAAKTQLLWLGSRQLLDKVDCRDVLVLSTRVAISDTARDLGVEIGRAHV